ncbi:MAG TPA: response regulator [Tepidisphaeraceae bacterium]|jgi:CheY-like chemotaxis protein
MIRVLLVEDHADSREAMALLLRWAGYEVDTAENGREALASVIERPPDVLLVDLEMPEMNGVKLVEAIRCYHRLSAIPVIFLTALGSGMLYEEARSLHVSSMLLKSIATFDQIHGAVENALAHPGAGNRAQAAEKWRGDSISPL